MFERGSKVVLFPRIVILGGGFDMGGAVFEEVFLFEGVTICGEVVKAVEFLEGGGNGGGDDG